MAAKRRLCPCCKHKLPHCPCKHNRPPKAPPQPVTVRPNRCQLRWFMNLSEMAYHLGRSLFGPRWPADALTVAQVSGAISALGLRNDKTVVDTASKGKCVSRQQTMLYTSELRKVQDYLATRLGVTPHQQPPRRVR
jgi:hypothetical protein